MIRCLARSLAVALVLLGVSWMPPAVAQQSSAKVLRVAFPIAETGFDPQAAGDAYSNYVNRAIFDPLYRHLKSARPGLLGTEAIKWNFTKFLVDRSGNVVARFAPNDTPESIERDVAKALG